MARKRIGEILVQAGVLGDAELKAALVEQRRWGGPLGNILIEMNMVTEEVLVQALSQQLKFPAVDLDHTDIADEVIDLVSGEMAAQHRIMPFKREGKFLDVAMSEPTNLGIIDELRIRTQLNVRSYLAGPKMIERAIERCYGPDALEDLRASASGAPPGAMAGTQSGPYSVPTSRPNIQLDRLRTRERDGEIQALQARISQLEALVSRDEDVLRKLMGLLIDKGVATREEILERIR
jgi:hypothetical protein